MSKQLQWTKTRPVPPGILLQLRHAAGYSLIGRLSAGPGEVYATVLVKVGILCGKKEEGLRWQPCAASDNKVIRKEQRIIFSGPIRVHNCLGGHFVQPERSGGHSFGPITWGNRWKPGFYD